MSCVACTYICGFLSHTTQCTPANHPGIYQVLNVDPGLCTTIPFLYVYGSSMARPLLYITSSSVSQMYAMSMFNYSIIHVHGTQYVCSITACTIIAPSLDVVPYRQASTIVNCEVYQISLVSYFSCLTQVQMQAYWQRSKCF